MIKNITSSACVAAMAMLSVASVSCHKDQTNSIGQYSIEASMNLQDVWSIVAPSTKADDEPKAMYQYFFFNSSGQIVDHAGYYFNESQQSKNFSRTLDFIKEAGTYDIVGVTNLLQGEYPTMYTAPKSSFGKDALTTLTSVRDICLGTTSLTVKPSQINYTTSVQAYHIMAQLGVSISGVPADITDLSVTLPNQSNQFDFNGKFYGSSQSIALNIVRDGIPASDGTYTWSVLSQDSFGTYNWQLIYPSANATAEGETVPTSMPLTVVAKDSSNITYTFNTSTTTRCTPGTRTLLTATWTMLNYTDTSTMAINSWQGSQQTGSFELI